MLTVWTQNANSIKSFLVLQKKSLWIMHCLKRNVYTSVLFKTLNILKLSDKVSLQNCILICKYFNQSLLKKFKNWFALTILSYARNIRWSTSGCLTIPSHKTKIYVRHSVNRSAIYKWSYLQKFHTNILLYQLTLTKFKSLIKKLYTSNYN